MIRLLTLGLLICGIYYVATGGSSIITDIRNGNAALVLDGMTPAELNTQIIEYYKKTIPEGVQEFTTDAIDTVVSDLNDDGIKDVIAIVDTSHTCGSGGCTATIFIKDDLGSLKTIPFEYAVKHIEVLGSLTRGMHDLRVNHDQSQTIIWNGSTYQLEQN